MSGFLWTFDETREKITPRLHSAERLRPVKTQHAKGYPSMSSLAVAFLWHFSFINLLDNSLAEIKCNCKSKVFTFSVVSLMASLIAIPENKNKAIEFMISADNFLVTRMEFLVFGSGKK